MVGSLEGDRLGKLVTEGTLEKEGLTEGTSVADGRLDLDGSNEGILVRLGMSEADGSFESEGMLDGASENGVGAGLRVGRGVIGLVGPNVGGEVGVATQEKPFPVKPECSRLFIYSRQKKTKVLDNDLYISSTKFIRHCIDLTFTAGTRKSSS